MALSKSTLSGCLVSLVMGFSYFLRRRPQEDSTANGDRNCKITNGVSNHNESTQIQHGAIASDCAVARRNLLHLAHGGFRIGSVKYRRPCDNPVTPCAHHIRQVIRCMPPSISMGNAKRSLPPHAASLRTFSSAFGINSGPQTRIHAHHKHVVHHFQESSSTATGVAGLITTPASAPSFGSSQRADPGGGRLPDAPSTGRRRPR